jgi:hypothetical protein
MDHEYAPTFERVHAMAEACGRASLRMPVVDIDVDPEVVAGESVLVRAAGIEEGAADRVLPVERTHGPAAERVDVAVTEVRRQRTGDLRAVSVRERRQRRDNRPVRA